MSGYTVDEATNRFDDEKPDAFLEKPFVAENLIAEVGRLVSTSRDSR